MAVENIPKNIAVVVFFAVSPLSDLSFLFFEAEAVELFVSDAAGSVSVNNGGSSLAGGSNCSS